MDRLEHMLRMQEQLELRFFDPKTLTPEQKAFWTKEMALATVRELGELLDATPYSKTWKTQYPPLDRDNVVGELVDILHFWLSLLVVWQVGVEEIHQAYVKKNLINWERYRQGY